MRPGSSCFPSRRPAPHRRWLFASAAVVALATALAAPAALADGPPSMEYLRLYGRVLADNTDLEPQAQPVIALIGGVACGDGVTRRAAEPPADAGMTVYVLQVLRDGPEAGERPGCGRPGVPVTLYFPFAGRIAQEQPFWASGPRSQDLTLTAILSHRSAVPAVAADGAP